MLKKDFREIYRQYLNRDPNPGDYIQHIHKSKSIFLKELINCDEYKNRIIKQPEETEVESDVAIILSGHLRRNSIKQFINEKNYNFKADVFVHTWDDFGLKGQEQNLETPNREEVIEIELNTIHNLKNYRIENNKELYSKWNGHRNRKDLEGITVVNHSSPEFFIYSQLYSINQSFRILKEYCIINKKKYDYVIKLRFDCEGEFKGLPSPVVKEVNNSKLLFLPDKFGHTHMDSLDTEHGNGCAICNRMYYDRTEPILIPHTLDHCCVLCDFYAMGSFDSMEHYCNAFNEYIPFLIRHSNSNKKAIEQLNKEGGLVAAFKQEHDHTYDLWNLRSRRGKQFETNSHFMSTTNFACSYPERLLTDHLKGYICVANKYSKFKLIR